MNQKPQEPEGKEREAVLYSIGHSNHTAAGFLNMLNQHGVARVVDVRSHPKSNYVPHFNRKELESFLTGEGIDYQYEGQSLGGRPATERLYRNGVADYGLMAQETPFITTLNKILLSAGDHPTAFMCTEKDPEKCHRSLLIAEKLRIMGHDTVHIKPRKVTVRHSDLVQALRAKLGEKAVETQGRAIAYRK